MTLHHPGVTSRLSAVPCKVVSAHCHGVCVPLPCCSGSLSVSTEGQPICCPRTLHLLVTLWSCLSSGVSKSSFSPQPRELSHTHKSVLIMSLCFNIFNIKKAKDMQFKRLIFILSLPPSKFLSMSFHLRNISNNVWKCVCLWARPRLFFYFTL